MSGPNSNSRLHDLAVKYASDKLYWHSYIPMYEGILRSMNIPVKRVLEIGIGHRDLMQPLLPAGVEYVHGSSLMMWEEYFPGARIFGCDIRPDTLFYTPNISTMRCDQSDRKSLHEMLYCFGAGWSGRFDLIIDDGSHVFEHQVITADTLLPYVREGGFYIVEDCWIDKGEVLAKEFHGDLWQGDKGRDDNLVVICR